MAFSSGLELVWVKFQGLAWKPSDKTSDRVWESPGWHRLKQGLAPAFAWLKSHSSQFFREDGFGLTPGDAENPNSSGFSHPTTSQQPIFQRDLKKGRTESSTATPKWDHGITGGIWERVKG